MDTFAEHALTRAQLEAKRTERPASSQQAARSHARLRLHVLASGSKGNCSVVENVATGKLVVIDCGISKRAFLERSEQCGINPRRIEAILVPHEHTDHTKGLGVVTRGLAKLGVQPTLFASELVHAASSEIRAIEDAVDVQHFARGEDLSLAGVAVHAFATLHDAAESFGFRFDAGGESIGFMTDTGIVTAEAFEALQGCNVLAIETNHDLTMLKYGPYPLALKKRIASEYGHLSNLQSAELLERLLCNELEQVIGMHISENNNNYALPKDALAEVLARNGHPAYALSSRQNTPASI